MNIVIIILLVIIIAILLHMNSKIPPRDHVKEAMKRDEQHKH